MSNKEFMKYIKDHVVVKVDGGKHVNPLYWVKDKPVTIINGFIKSDKTN